MIGIEGVGLKKEMETLSMEVIHLILYFYNYSSLQVDGMEGLAWLKERNKKQEM